MDVPKTEVLIISGLHNFLFLKVFDIGQVCSKTKARSIIDNFLDQRIKKGFRCSV